MLRAEKLTCGYGGRPAVHDADLAVEAGEFCALLGRNGCGKTTLLRCLGGLLRPMTGRVFVDGADCAAMSPRRRARSMACIPQRGSALEGRTVLEAVLMGFNPRLGLLETPGAAMRAQAEEALARLGLAGWGDRDCGAVSEGQRQLVILARTMVQDTPVLLMDEPDSALDFVNRHMVLEQVGRVIRREGKAGLIALHDPGFALAYCDRLLLMEEGRILRSLPLKGVSRETAEEALRLVYGPVRVLEHEGGMTVVWAGS